MPSHARAERNWKFSMPWLNIKPKWRPDLLQGKNTNKIAGSEKKNRASIFSLGFWIPTASHQNNFHGLREDLTWIFHHVTFLSLVWIPPYTDVLCLQKSLTLLSAPLCRRPLLPPSLSFLILLFLCFSANQPYTCPLCRPKTLPSLQPQSPQTPALPSCRAPGK